MLESRWTWTTDTKLPSQKGAHLPLLEEILSELARLGWNGRDFFGIQMALEESLTNAIRHGNRFDHAKQVHVECKLGPDHFWLRITDEGAGFQPQAVPDCTCDENLESPGGRGVALMRAYMNRVEYNDCGNCVTMEKNRTT